MIDMKKLPSTDRLNNVWFEGVPDDNLFEHANFTLYSTCICLAKRGRSYFVKLKGKRGDSWYGRWTVIFRTDSQTRAYLLFIAEVTACCRTYSSFFTNKGV